MLESSALIQTLVEQNTQRWCSGCYVACGVKVPSVVVALLVVAVVAHVMR
jgi:hypothetical protein